MTKMRRVKGLGLLSASVCQDESITVLYNLSTAPHEAFLVNFCQRF